MKMWRNLIIMLAIIAVLVGGYFILTNYLSTVAEEEKLAEEKGEVICKFDEEKVEKVIYKNPKGEVKFERHEKYGWTILSETFEEMDTFKMSQGIAEMLLMRAKSFVEENPTDLSKYGLDKPAATCDVVLKNGKTQIISLGNVNPVTGEFYLLYGKKVYTITRYVAETFDKEIVDYMKSEAFYIKRELMAGVTFYGDGQKLLEIIENNDESMLGADSGFSMYKMKYPYEDYDVNITNLDSMFLAHLSNMSFTFARCVKDDNAIADAKYGFDKPKYQFNVLTKEEKGLDPTTQSTAYDIKEVVIKVGNTIDDKIYITNDSTNKVYAFDADVLEFTKTLDPFQILDRKGALINIANVKNIAITGKDNVEHNLAIEQENIKQKISYNISIDGIKANSNTGMNFYSKITSLEFDEIYSKDSEINSVPEYIIVFTMKDGTQVTFTFMPLDDRNYTFTRNGKTEFVIRKNKLDKLSEQLATFIKDPTHEEELIVPEESKAPETMVNGVGADE